MGICCCKSKEEEHDVYVPQRTNNQNIGINTNAQQQQQQQQQQHHQQQQQQQQQQQTNISPRYSTKESKIVDRLVLETLRLIATLVDNEQDPPPSMLALHNIADNEEGFIQVVKSMTNVIPLSYPLGPSIITLLLDDCPLPSKESVFNVINMFNLSRKRAITCRSNPTRERNICVVLGCIAETLAGPRNLQILSDNILDYLITNLEPQTDPNVILFALIALEKCAQHSENKSIILKRLETMNPCPVVQLEMWHNESHYVKRQVGFCAKWALDNLFLMDNRKYSYLTINMDHINAMLNVSDASEYLKISPDGLEARSDAYSFESVRCTAQVDSGIWYYEVLIITTGVMQIGWATKNSNFLNHEGYGIGDDMYSIAYDGCRKLIWYNAKSEPQNIQTWKSGDILGCLLNLETKEIIFSINGMSLPPCSHVFSKAKSGFFAAASFMSFQQCRFNFGAKPFKYPPDIPFSNFNEFGILKDEDKVVMPRHILFNKLKQHNIREDSCTLCYDQKASVRLIPCEHSGFCTNCASQLLECPMCRAPFELVIEEETS